MMIDWLRVRYRPDGEFDAGVRGHGRDHSATGPWHAFDPDTGALACGSVLSPERTVETTDGWPIPEPGHAFRVCRGCEKRVDDDA